MVTDFGKSEIAKKKSIPKNLATKAVKTVFTTTARKLQRLEIARTLYHNSRLILADEVKANLDSENSQKISDLLFSLPQTVIEVIHHYSEEDLKRYDQVIHLYKADKIPKQSKN